MFDYNFYGTHFCRYVLIIFFKLSLDVTTTIQIVCMHTIMYVNSIHIYMETILNQVNHFKYDTCEIIEHIIEWDMISKCLFGADVAKCKNIIANC